MGQRGWEWDNVGDNETTWVTTLTMRQHGWEWDKAGENETAWVTMRQLGWEWDNMGENETTRVKMRQSGWQWYKVRPDKRWKHIYIYLLTYTYDYVMLQLKSIRERRKMWIYPRNRYMLAWLSRGSGALWKYQSFKFFWHCTFYLYILTFLDFPE